MSGRRAAPGDSAAAVPQVARRIRDLSVITVGPAWVLGLDQLLEPGADGLLLGDQHALELVDRLLYRLALSGDQRAGGQRGADLVHGLLGLRVPPVGDEGEHEPGLVDVVVEFLRL